MRISPRHIVNGITLYRLFSAPIMFILVLTGEMNIFKCLLAISFFTDAIDGWMARRLKVTSVWGSRLDSIGDDVTVAAGIFGMLLHKQDFLRSEIVVIIIVVSLFLIQSTAAFVRFGKLTSFHTYLAKVSAILQGSFLILVFFLPQPSYFLFYATMVLTTADLVEEILIVALLVEWRTDVRGLYWVIKEIRSKRSARTSFRNQR